jgi:DNA-binding SARP family transcriptional activator
MRFNVLGPLLAHDDNGTPLILARPSQRGTLSVLLIHAQRPRTKAFLIDAIWGDDPPCDAEAALRVRVRDLRLALAGRRRLITHRSGYQMLVESGELDITIFHDLAAQGRTALDRGSAAEAAQLLGKACNLWRDPPLADLPDTPIMRVAATSLREEWRDVQEWLIDARLALGEERTVLAQIRAVIAADPLAEHAHVQLMLALYRCGQKSAALAAYAKLRDLTTHEFGQDPGPEAQMLLQQILLDSADLNFRPMALTASARDRRVHAPVSQRATRSSRRGRGVSRCRRRPGAGGTSPRWPPQGEPGGR